MGIPPSITRTSRSENPMARATFLIHHMVARPVTTLLLLPSCLCTPCSCVYQDRETGHLQLNYTTCVSSASETLKRRRARPLNRKTAPVQQWLLRVAIGEQHGGFAGSLAVMARQLWDLMEAHCARLEYAIRTAKAACSAFFHLQDCRDDNDLSHGRSSP